MIHEHTYPPIQGPLCEYWWEETATICGHSSCYEIVFSDKEADDE